MERHYEIVPVPTRILTVHDNIAEAIAEFGGHKIGPKDVVCVAESVVAITQNRAIRPELLVPCFWARILSQLFPAKGSIASWNAMQSLMNEEGEYRVLLAVICGFFAKMAGRAGVFYQMAGLDSTAVQALILGTGLIAGTSEAVVAALLVPPILIAVKKMMKRA